MNNLYTFAYMRKDLNGARHFSIGIKFTILLFTIAILVLVLFSYRSDKHGNLFWQVEKLIPHHPDSAFGVIRESDGYQWIIASRESPLLSVMGPNHGMRRD